MKRPKRTAVQLSLFSRNACKRPRKKRYLPLRKHTCWCGAEIDGRAILCAFHASLAKSGNGRYRIKRLRGRRSLALRLLKKRPVMTIRSLINLPAEKWGSLEFQR